MSEQSPPAYKEVARRIESPELEEVNLGWVLTLRTQGLIADWGEAGGFGAYRGWHSAGKLELASNERRVHAQLVLEGVMRCIVDGVEIDVGPGEILLVRGSSQATMAALTEVRSYNWALTNAALDNPVFRPLLAEPIRLDDPDRSPVVGATNVLLSSRAMTNSAASYAYGRGIEQIMAGALLDRPRWQGVTRYSPNVSTLLVDAQNVIEERFRDPGFGVRDLAAALHVSLSTLYRPYQALGTTPRAEIVNRRVLEAMTMLHGRETVRRGELRVIAELTGFREARYLRSALRRAELRQGSAVTQVEAG